MTRDRFLDAIRCDRCGKSLEGGKVESGNGDILCMRCVTRESYRRSHKFASINNTNGFKARRG